MAIEINGTTGISGVDGSAATPALQGADTNTGISFGTDEVGINTGGTERVKVDSSGNVGIGTGSPSSRMSVQASGVNGIHLAQQAGVADNSGRLFFDNATNIWTAYSTLGTFKIASGATIGTTSGTDRFVINSSGNVGIGTTSLGGYRLHVTSDGATTVNIRRDTSTGGLIDFNYGSSGVGNISTNGSTTSYNTSSDYRLKENVVDLDGAITRVKQLAPKRFNFIADADTTVDGFLAHEAQAVVPEAVVGTHDQVDDDGNPVYQGIDQCKLVPLLTAALQEAIAKIETLETKVAALEGGAS